MTSRPVSLDEALEILARLRACIADTETLVNAGKRDGLVQDLVSEGGRLADTLAQIAASTGVSRPLVERIQLALNAYVAIRDRLARSTD